MCSYVVRVTLAVTDQLWIAVYVVVMYFDFDGSTFIVLEVSLVGILLACLLWSSHKLHSN